MMLLLALFIMTACHKTNDTTQVVITAPDEYLIGGFPRDSIGEGTMPAASEKEVTLREDCCDTICPNNFTVSLVPYTKSTCLCLKGYIAYNKDTCPDTTLLVRGGSGINQGGTGFNNICAGSDIVLCIDTWGDAAPFCENTCFSGLILVSALGVPMVQYPYCFDVANGPVCITLGKVECCQPTSNNCRWTPNTNYLDGTTTCTPCGTKYNCTTDPT